METAGFFIALFIFTVGMVFVGLLLGFPIMAALGVIIFAGTIIYWKRPSY